MLFTVTGQKGAVALRKCGSSLFLHFYCLSVGKSSFKTEKIFDANIIIV